MTCKGRHPSLLVVAARSAGPTELCLAWMLAFGQLGIEPSPLPPAPPHPAADVKVSQAGAVRHGSAEAGAWQAERQRLQQEYLNKQASYRGCVQASHNLETA